MAHRASLIIRTLLIMLMAFALIPACSDKKDGDGGGGASEEASGPNPFQIRKDSIDAYMKAVDDAADLDAAVAAGQGWLDTNFESYKKNCSMLIEYRKDLKKSKMNRGIKTPFNDYMDRLSKKAGGPMKAGPLVKQFNSFFNCDNAIKT